MCADHRDDHLQNRDPKGQNQREMSKLYDHAHNLGHLPRPANRLDRVIMSRLGAHQIGVMQSLLVTCKLHDIDPYDYLVDVLQRISQHPNSKIDELTPRRWKELFANNPMRSALHQTVAN